MSRFTGARANFVHFTLLTIMTSLAYSETCNRPPDEALYSGAQDCLVTESFPERFSDFFRLSAWEKLCFETDSVGKCVRERFLTCSLQYKKEVIRMAMSHLYGHMNTWMPSVNSLIRMIRQGCRGPNVQESIAYAYHQADSLSCMTNDTRSKVMACVKIWLQETADIRLSGNTSYLALPDRHSSLIRFGLSTFQCVRNLIRINCSPWAHDLLLFLVNQTVPQSLRTSFPKERVDIALNKKAILSNKRDSVGTYGGLHLIVHNLSKPSTCSHSGHVIYLSNQLFTITGHVVDNMERLSLNKIAIEFYRTGGGISGHYETMDGKLETTFVYGYKELSPYYDSIDIIPGDSDSKIQINSTSLGYIFIIRMLNEGYMFSIRISDDVLKTSSGELISGCSHTKQQTTDIISDEGVEAHDRCLASCEDVLISDDDLTVDLREACVFDCLTFADTNSSKVFLDDVTESKYYDSMLSLFEAPTTPEPTVSSRSGSPVPVIYILRVSWLGIYLQLVY